MQGDRAEHATQGAPRSGALSRVQALAEAMRAVSAAANRDPSAVLDELAHQAEALLGCDGASIHLAEGSGDGVVFRRIRLSDVGRAGGVPPNSTWRADAASLASLRLGQTIFHEDLSTIVAPDVRTLPWLRNIASALYAPLIAGEEPLGLLVAAWLTRRRPDPELLLLGDALARCAAVAVHTARLIDATERSADRSARLQAVTAALSAALDPAQVADVIISNGLRALGAQAGSVGVMVEDGTKVEMLREIGYVEGFTRRWSDLQRTLGYSPENVEGKRRFSLDTPGPFGDALRTGAPVWLDESTGWRTRYPALAEVLAASGFVAGAALPLAVEGRIIGGLRLHFADALTFHAEDRAFMVALAHQCAQALERARLYEAQHQARHVAEEALRAREEFLSVAAHELKTPVTSLRLGAQVILRRLEGGRVADVRELRDPLRRIDEQAARLATLVNRLLDSSRIDAGKLALETTVTDLVPLVERAVDVARAASGRKGLVVRSSPSLRARVDGLRFSQVVANLLDNAIKFSPPESPIDVELSQPAPRTVRLVVCDRGLGIPPERRAGLFERFFQAHEDGHHGGMGLGLYISRQIVELHGGTIAAEHPKDGGTRFVVTLPQGDVESSLTQPDEPGSASAAQWATSSAL